MEAVSNEDCEILIVPVLLFAGGMWFNPKSGHNAA
jgi:hypothetical protein